MATSHTELQTFRRCPREWHIRYVRRREPKVTAKPLEVGKRIDTAIKKVQLGEKVDFHSLLPEERALVQGYAARWEGTLKTTRVDVPFKIRMGAAEVVGEIDSIAIDPAQGGRTVLSELKTTSFDITPGSDYWRKIVNVEPQPTIYLFAAREQGLSTPFLVWDVMRKPALRQGVKETDEMFYDRVLQDIVGRPNWYYQRAIIVRSDDEHAAHVRDVNGTVHLMQVVHASGDAPRNPDACFHFNRACSFLDVCSGSVSLDDPTRFKDRERKNFQTEKPKNLFDI